MKIIFIPEELRHFDEKYHAENRINCVEIKIID